MTSKTTAGITFGTVPENLAALRDHIEETAQGWVNTVMSILDDAHEENRRRAKAVHPAGTGRHRRYTPQLVWENVAGQEDVYALRSHDPVSDQLVTVLRRDSASGILIDIVHRASTKHGVSSTEWTSLSYAEEAVLAHLTECYGPVAAATFRVDEHEAVKTSADRPLNWVAQGPDSNMPANYVLTSSDPDVGQRAWISRRRTVLGTWTVEMKLFGHPRISRDWTSETKADAFVRYTLRSNGFTEDQIATFEKPAEEKAPSPEMVAAVGKMLDRDWTRMVFEAHDPARTWDDLTPDERSVWGTRSSRLYAAMRAHAAAS